jgi:hypothetical protein
MSACILTGYRVPYNTNSRTTRELGRATGNDVVTKHGPWPDAQDVIRHRIFGERSDWGGRGSAIDPGREFDKLPMDDGVDFDAEFPPPRAFRGPPFAGHSHGSRRLRGPDNGQLAA